MNRVAAEHSWHVHPERNVTTFRVDPDEPPERWAGSILSTVAEHFGAYDGNNPNYDVVEVVGATPTGELRARLVETGFLRFDEATNSFRASRIDAAV